jgi:threonine/homoserine/homoserine lactone efflux protein
VAAPGPDWAFVLSTVSRRGSLVAAVLGLVVGYLVMTGAVASGLGFLLVRAPSALKVLTLLGSGYLVWLGWRTWRSARGAPVDTVEDVIRPRSTFVAGVGVSAFNPKALLVFAALLPQFVRSGGMWPVALQLAVLGLVFTALVGAFYPLLGTVAATLVVRSRRLRLLLARAAGTVMIVLGVLLLAELGWGASRR